jgi:hypothetical protein
MPAATHRFAGPRGLDAFNVAVGQTLVSQTVEARDPAAFHARLQPPPVAAAEGKNGSSSGRHCADNASTPAKTCGRHPVTTAYRHPASAATRAAALKARWSALRR